MEWGERSTLLSHLGYLFTRLVKSVEPRLLELDLGGRGQGRGGGVGWGGIRMPSGGCFWNSVSLTIWSLVVSGLGVLGLLFCPDVGRLPMT